MSNNLKRNAVKLPYDKPPEFNIAKHIPTLITYDLILIRNNIYYTRSSTIQKLPDNLLDLQNVLLKENIKTNQDELFTFVNDNENNTDIFQLLLI